MTTAGCHSTKEIIWIKMFSNVLLFFSVFFQTRAAVCGGEWWQSCSLGQSSANAWWRWCTWAQRLSWNIQYHISCRCLSVAQRESVGFTAGLKGALSSYHLWQRAWRNQQLRLFSNDCHGVHEGSLAGWKETPKPILVFVPFSAQLLIHKPSLNRPIWHLPASTSTPWTLISQDGQQTDFSLRLGFRSAHSYFWGVPISSFLILSTSVSLSQWLNNETVSTFPMPIQAKQQSLMMNDSLFQSFVRCFYIWKFENFLYI